MSFCSSANVRRDASNAYQLIGDIFLVLGLMLGSVCRWLAVRESATILAELKTFSTEKQLTGPLEVASPSANAGLLRVEPMLGSRVVLLGCC